MFLVAILTKVCQIKLEFDEKNSLGSNNSRRKISFGKIFVTFPGRSFSKINCSNDAFEQFITEKGNPFRNFSQMTDQGGNKKKKNNSEKQLCFSN